jgi:hypothetical protein
MTRPALLTLAAAAVGLCLSFTLVAMAEEPASVAGTWKATVEIAGTTGSPTFTFKQEGESLSGRYKGQFGEAELTGTMKGSEIEFSFEIQAGARASYRGTLADGKLKGTCDYAGQAQGTWTAEKAPE